jgi:hypothetical protein
VRLFVFGFVDPGKPIGEILTLGQGKVRQEKESNQPPKPTTLTHSASNSGGLRQRIKSV